MRDKDLVVAKYIPEPTTDGYLARIQIEFHRRDADNHSLDYAYPRPFTQMNDALAKCFELLARWRRKYAPDADVIIEPPSRP
jgi:hypothetical protein